MKSNYEIKRSDEEIARFEAWAMKAFESGETRYPGMSYEDGAREADVLIFILVDGYLQPHYFNVSEDAVDFTSLIIPFDNPEDEPGYSHTFRITLDPIYVPYGKTSLVSVLVSPSPHALYDNPLHYFTPAPMSPSFTLTADNRENQIHFEKEKNSVDYKTDFVAKAGSPNFFIAEKLTGSWQWDRNAYFETEGQVYASSHVIGAGWTSDVRIFVVIDGRLVPTFGGEYYCDLDRQPGVTCEIPLDMGFFPRGEMHKVNVIIIDMAAIDEINSKGLEAASPFFSDSSLLYTVLVK
jgi:hypothetical protein